MINYWTLHSLLVNVYSLQVLNVLIIIVAPFKVVAYFYFS